MECFEIVSKYQAAVKLTGEIPCCKMELAEYQQGRLGTFKNKTHLYKVLSRYM